MVVLLTETNALKMPILQIKNTVEETQVTVEESKRTVQNIFEAIKGPLHPQFADIFADANNYRTDDRRLAILNWISDISPTKHHDFNRSFRSAGTGGWLLEKQSFREWADSDSSSLLWLHGIAGSGKTMLA